MSSGAGVLTGGTATAARSLDRRHTVAGVTLGAIVVVAAALRFWRFGSVQPDPFYDAAVRSMGRSWHNFFFGALEPGGQVAVDKAPLDLWLQVASTKAFGFTSTALRVPEALAGILCVPLLFDTVRRLFGVTAGLAAAAVLAVLPLAVLTARSDTMDSLMVLMLLAASWCVVRASHSGGVGAMAAAGVAVGLAFNVKLFEGLVLVPALLGLAIAARTVSWRRLALQLAAGALALVAVALAWIAAVSLANGPKPWPVGSRDGTVWDVVFRFNGTARVSVPAPSGQALVDPPGPLRLFGRAGVHFEALVGSTLTPALVVGLAALVFALVRRVRGGAPLGPLRRGGVAWIVVWLVTGGVLFSTMARVHTRYVEAMSPAIAAALGVGVTVLAVAALRRLTPAWLLAGATVASCVLVVGLGSPPPAAADIAMGAAAATVAMAAVRSRTGPGGARRLTHALLIGALVATLAVPAGASVQVIAGAQQNSGTPGSMPPRRLAALSRYLIAHQDGARYETAVATVMRSPALIVHDGRPVLSLTSVYALPLVSAPALARLVRSGQVRYVIVGRGRCGRHPRASCTPAVRWAFRHGRDVSAGAGQPAGQLLRMTGRLVPARSRVSARVG